MVTFRRITPEEWAQLPASTAKKGPGKWDELLGAVEAGEIVELPLIDVHTLRGTRVSITRLAKGRGFTVEYRIRDNNLYVKRSAVPVRAQAPAANSSGTDAPRRRGRPRRNASQETVTTSVAEMEGE